LIGHSGLKSVRPVCNAAAAWPFVVFKLGGNTMKRNTLLAGVALAALLLAPSAAPAQTASFSDTVTWHCLDLNQALQVNVPVVVGVAQLTRPADSTLPPCLNTSNYRIQVPSGLGWAVWNFAWTMNTHYTKEVKAALEATGYHFVSGNPPTDLLTKLTEVRYDVSVFDEANPSNRWKPVATYTFDPLTVYRQVQWKTLYSAFAPASPVSIPELGIKINSNQYAALPTLSFPAVGGALPPGRYRACVTFVLSEAHNDGLGVDEGNFLGPGELAWGCPQFDVTP
jgi:hypothetical protein